MVRCLFNSKVGGWKLDGEAQVLLSKTELEIWRWHHCKPFCPPLNRKNHTEAN